MNIEPRYTCSDVYQGHPAQAAMIVPMIIAHPDAKLCLEWPYKKTRMMHYGLVRHDGRDWVVHRLAWKIVHGILSPEICVLHKCDNPPCFNPDHLFLGTRTDNAADRQAKGRTRFGITRGPRGPRPDLWGENNVTSKLTAEKVTQILNYLEQGRSQQSIASEFGVNQTLISAIKLGRTWRHITHL